jgi:hypothetical protein
MGSVGMATAPASTISREQTVAKTGLRMKKPTMKATLCRAVGGGYNPISRL